VTEASVEFDMGQLAVIVAIIGQTSVLSVWLGRLSQRVQDIKEDIDEFRSGTVTSQSCQLMHGDLARRVEACELSLKGIERRKAQENSDARSSV
jgi:hypothetical protein